MDRHYVNILGVEITSTRKLEVLEYLSSQLGARSIFAGRHLPLGKALFVTTPNPEIVLTAFKNPSFAKVLNSSDIAIADGIGLKVAAKLYGKNLQVIKGRELMIDLFKLANKNSWRVFLLGSTPEVIEKSLHKISKNYPKIRVQGKSGPVLNNKAETVSDLYKKLDIDILNRINQFEPHILFVAFGAPKQEFWISKNVLKLHVGAVMSVGGSLDYYSGLKPLPPKWMDNLGLEWLWRVINEPSRIGRIIKATVLFPLAVIRDMI